MIVKKENKLTKYIKYILLLVIVILFVIFRARVVSSFFFLKQKYFMTREPEVLTLSEHDELNALRQEVKLLKDENKKIQDEFSVGAVDEKRSPVYMLMNGSTFYGSLYTSLPKDKTPYKGMNIFTEGNIVIGQVEEIVGNSMKVYKMGQGKAFVADSLENEESIELSSLGSGLYIGTAPSGSKISLGDTIVLKGYPKAIVGTVVEIQKGDSSLSNVFIRTPYNVDNKEIFYVLQ